MMTILSITISVDVEVDSFLVKRIFQSERHERLDDRRIIMNEFCPAY
jgi:hypothetical protein